MKNVDKQVLRDKLFSLEAMSIGEANHQFDEFLRGARLDRTGATDDGDRSQTVQSATIASKLEDQLHEHEDHLKILNGFECWRQL